MASCMLPLSSNSLIYGSNDQGETAHANDVWFNDLMERAARVLNIKGHIVGRLTPVLLHAPCDIEVCC
jgi:hypothetical protein